MSLAIAIVAVYGLVTWAVLATHECMCRRERIENGEKEAAYLRGRLKDKTESLDRVINEYAETLCFLRDVYPKVFKKAIMIIENGREE